MFNYIPQPDDWLDRQPNRLDIQRARLMDQRRNYQAMNEVYARQNDRRAPLRYLIRRPLLAIRYALGRALVGIGRQLAADASGDAGGSTPTGHGLRAMHKAN